MLLCPDALDVWCLMPGCLPYLVYSVQSWFGAKLFRVFWTQGHVIYKQHCFAFFFSRMNAFHFLSLPSCPGLVRIFSLAYGSKMNLEFLFSQEEKVRATSFMVEGENQLLKADLWSPYMCHDTCTMTWRHIQRLRMSRSSASCKQICWYSYFFIPNEGICILKEECFLKKKSFSGVS